MIRVFLAEDDMAVRQMIRGGVEWAKEGLELMGEAADGGVALAMFMDLHADILIASRRMPFLDGADLFRAVRARMPWVQCILLSGYDGRTGALGEDVSKNWEVLLKPVSLRELTEALRQAARRVDETLKVLGEAVRRPDVPAAGEGAGLNRWLETGESWPEGMKCCLLKVLPGVPLGENWREEIFNLLERGVMHRQDTRAVYLPDGAPGLMVAAREEAELEEEAYGSADAILSTVERMTGARPHIHISQTAWDAPSLKAAWERLANSPLDPRRSILGQGDAMRLRPGVRPPLNPMGEWLLSAGEEELEDMLRLCAQAGLLSPERVAGAAAQLIEEALGRVEGEWTPQADLDGIRDQLVRAMRLARERAPWLAQSPLSRARKYLSIHFRNPGLQLYNVAQDSGMTAKRFRMVFAQEMGMTFTEYMRGMRVSGAKALLSDTRMRVSGIARAVGYFDVTAFCEMFQSVTGMDPKEYRSRYARKA